MHNEIIATDATELCVQLENAWTELSMWRDGEIVREEDVEDRISLQNALIGISQIVRAMNFGDTFPAITRSLENADKALNKHSRCENTLPNKSFRETFDTPETDASCWKSSVRGHGTLEDCDPELCYADFARKLELELDAVIAQNAEIFRNLGLPHGDMGALENYILEKNKLTTNTQLKFRAWDHQTKKFSYFGIRNTMGHLPTDIPDENIKQFTGLVDYVGDEIYEGDILQEPGGYELEKDIGVCKKTLGGWKIFSLRGNAYHVWKSLVVGNIFENPELLDK